MDVFNPLFYSFTYGRLPFYWRSLPTLFNFVKMKTSAISWTKRSGAEKVDDGASLTNGRCPHPLSLHLVLFGPTPLLGVPVGNLGTLPEVVLYTTALPAVSAQVVRLAVVRIIGGGPLATFAAFGSLT